MHSLITRKDPYRAFNVVTGEKSPRPTTRDRRFESQTKGLRGSMSQITSALVLASRLTQACISAQELATTTAISKFTSRVGKFCLMSISDRSPRQSQPYGFPRPRSWVAGSDWLAEPEHTLSYGTTRDRMRILELELPTALRSDYDLCGTQRDASKFSATGFAPRRSQPRCTNSDEFP